MAGEISDNSPNFGIKTTIRINPIGYERGEALQTDVFSNSVTLFGPKLNDTRSTDEWTFDGCFDSLPPDKAPEWGTNRTVFDGFWTWAQKQSETEDVLTCLVMGGPSAGKSYTLLGTGDITDVDNPDVGIISLFLFQVYASFPETVLEINASLVCGEDIIDLFNPPARYRAAENLAYSDTLGPIMLTSKTITCRSLNDALVVICVIWRTAAVLSLEGALPLSPCHTVISVSVLDKRKGLLKSVRFMEVAGHPSMYTLRQKLPASVDRFAGRSKHNKSVLLLAELTKQSLSNAQINPRQKKKTKAPMKYESSVLSYLLQDNLYQKPCCFIIGCIRPIVEHVDSNVLFLDFLQKLGQLLPIKNPNAAAYDRSILTRVPSFSGSWAEVARSNAQFDSVSASAPHSLFTARTARRQSLGQLVEKLQQEVNNASVLGSHCRELVIFDKELELDVYDGIVVKPKGPDAAEEKKKKKKAAADKNSAMVAKPGKKKGYKERERELKEKAEREALERVLLLEENRKKAKVALIKEVGGMFYRRVSYSDFILYMRKQTYLAQKLECLAAVSDSPRGMPSTKSFFGEFSTGDNASSYDSSAIDDVSNVLSWLGTRLPLPLSLFRMATEHIAGKSWLPPSAMSKFSTAQIVNESEKNNEMELDKEIPVPESDPVEVSDFGDGMNFHRPNFPPLKIEDVLEYTSSLVDPYLECINPNGLYNFDRITFQLEYGYTIITGIPVTLEDYENSSQRHQSEMSMRRVADIAARAAAAAVVPISETYMNPENETVDDNAIKRSSSKFSMTSDGDENLDPIQKIIDKEERRIEEIKKGNYSDDLEVFVAGLKTLGLFDIEAASSAKDIKIISGRGLGIEPIHCIFSRFGQKIKLQVFAGTVLEQHVVHWKFDNNDPTSSRPGTAGSSAGDVASSAQAAMLPLVWVNGAPLTTILVSESNNNSDINAKGKKRTIPMVCVLQDGDIVRIGVSTYFRVVIPEEVIEEAVIAGQDQTFTLEAMQSRGTTPSQRSRSRLTTPGNNTSVGVAQKQFGALTNWEQALVKTYATEGLTPLIAETETQRRHYLHLSVNRELAMIAKTAERNALMSMISFAPSNDEVADILLGLTDGLKSQLCNLLAAVDTANYLSQTMNRGTYMSLHIVYTPTYGDVDFPETVLDDEKQFSTLNKKKNAVEISPMVSPGVPVGRDRNQAGGEGAFNISYGGRRYECRVLVDFAGTTELGCGYRAGPSGNVATRSHWWWSICLFLERYSLMQELFGLFQSECGGDALLLDEALFNNDPISDPFIDPAQDELVGVAFLHLDGLFYLLDVVDVLPIFNFNGSRAGSIKVHMRCWIDDIETIPEYISVDKETNISSFMDHKLIIRIYFENLLDIPSVISGGLYVAFRFFFHGGTYSSSRHCGIASNPFLNDPVVIEQTITNDFIEYIKTGALELEVYGKRTVPNAEQSEADAPARPSNFNEGTSGPSFRLRSFGISTALNPYVNEITMAQVVGEPFDWKRGNASNLEGASSATTLKTIHALEEEIKHLEDALEESERMLRHANKLTATLKNDREVLQTDLSRIKEDLNPAVSTRQMLENLERELTLSRKEVERLSKKQSKVCVIS